ncbi:MAG: hypothetical protein GY827_09280 [Cytophagales bacterium]|nr:hypothetical protein [Cytophagales bacterium]
MKNYIFIVLFLLFGSFFSIAKEIRAEASSTIDKIEAVEKRKKKRRNLKADYHKNRKKKIKKDNHYRKKG